MGSCHSAGPHTSFVPIDGGQPRPIPGTEPGDAPITWADDDHSLYIYRLGDLPAKVYRLDVATGRRQFWKQLMPPDTSAVTDLTAIFMTPGAKAYVYEYGRTLSDLYMVSDESWRKRVAVELNCDFIKSVISRCCTPHASALS
jgi:hypothetical protein